ncbi:MAG: hypothetical protein O3A93_11645 [Chloroflexi bacterium]|nr:hypothetical protein [Chloroflexota bacterium]MDA1271891.1 hypothetical protein [Chloroflexota bacterium]
MPRPKANPAQELRAYQLHQDGYGPTAILQKLRQEFGDDNSVSSRTIATWVRNFKLKTNTLDVPFEWHRMDEYAIPWEAGEYLLELWRRFKESQISENIQPTVRQVRWWWRVHNTNEHLEPVALFEISQRFVARELAHHVLGEPQDMTDLEGWLAYRGWEMGARSNPTGGQRFNWAVENGIVPPLRPLEQERAAAYGVAEVTGNIDDLDQSIEALGTSQEHREWRAPRQRGMEGREQEPQGN